MNVFNYIHFSTLSSHSSLLIFVEFVVVDNLGLDTNEVYG